MSNPIHLMTPAVAQAVDAALSDALRMLQAATQAGVVDLRSLGAAVARIALDDPHRAADLLEGMKPALAAADHPKLAQEVAQAMDAHAMLAAPAADAAGGRATLLLDLAQAALGIAGIFDPTPTCDAIDGVISLMRGDHVGAAMSAASMVPYLGDAAKLGKLPAFAKTIGEAVDLVKTQAKLAAEAMPQLERIYNTVKAVAPGSVPEPLLDFARKVERQIGEVLSLGRRAVNPLPAPAAFKNPLPAEFGAASMLATSVLEKIFIRDFDQLLSTFGLRRIADDPVVRELWQSAVASLTGPGASNAYATATSKLAAGQQLTKREADAAFSAVQKKFSPLFNAHFGFPPGDIEHLANRAHFPDMVVDPRHLVVTPHRDIKEVLGTKVHELLHWVKSGGDSVGDPRYWRIQINGTLKNRFLAADNLPPVEPRMRPRAGTVEIPAEAGKPVTYRKR